jgi:hypothetical protein
MIPAPERHFFPDLGRALGRSRMGRILAAAVVVVFFGALAYAAWRWRDFSSAAVAAALTYYGLETAWRILPIRESARARWSARGEAAERCWPCRLRLLFWYGLLMAIIQFWQRRPGDSFDPSNFVPACVLVVTGLLGYLLCCRMVRADPA